MLITTFFFFSGSQVPHSWGFLDDSFGPHRLHNVFTMAEWDPVKWHLDRGLIYTHPDERVKGDLYPLEYYKYPDDIFGGTWEEGRQAIDDFDWGDEKQLDDGNVVWEAGLHEMDTFDWKQDSRDEQHNNSGTEVGTAKHEPSIKTSPQFHTDLAAPLQDGEHDPLSLPIRIESTPLPVRDLPDYFAIGEVPVREAEEGLSVRPPKEHVDEGVSLASPPSVEGQSRNDASGKVTMVDGEAVEDQGNMPDPHSSNSGDEAMDIDVEGQEEGTTTDGSASLTLVRLSDGAGPSTNDASDAADHAQIMQNDEDIDSQPGSEEMIVDEAATENRSLLSWHPTYENDQLLVSVVAPDSREVDNTQEQLPKAGSTAGVSKVDGILEVDQRLVGQSPVTENSIGDVVDVPSESISSDSDAAVLVDDTTLHPFSETLRETQTALPVLNTHPNTVAVEREDFDLGTGITVTDATDDGSTAHDHHVSNPLDLPYLFPLSQNCATDRFDTQEDLEAYGAAISGENVGSCSPVPDTEQAELDGQDIDMADSTAADMMVEITAAKEESRSIYRELKDASAAIQSQDVAATTPSEDAHRVLPETQHNGFDATPAPNTTITPDAENLDVGNVFYPKEGSTGTRVSTHELPPSPWIPEADRADVSVHDEAENESFLSTRCSPVVTDTTSEFSDAPSHISQDDLDQASAPDLPTNGQDATGESVGTKSTFQDKQSEIQSPQHVSAEPVQVDGDRDEQVELNSNDISNAAVTEDNDEIATISNTGAMEFEGVDENDEDEDDGVSTEEDADEMDLDEAEIAVTTPTKNPPHVPSTPHTLQASTPAQAATSSSNTSTPKKTRSGLKRQRIAKPKAAGSSEKKEKTPDPVSDSDGPAKKKVKTGKGEVWAAFTSKSKPSATKKAMSKAGQKTTADTQRTAKGKKKKTEELPDEVFKEQDEDMGIAESESEAEAGAESKDIDPDEALVQIMFKSPKSKPLIKKPPNERAKKEQPPQANPKVQNKTLDMSAAKQNTSGDEPLRRYKPTSLVSAPVSTPSAKKVTPGKSRKDEQLAITYGKKETETEAQDTVDIVDTSKHEARQNSGGDLRMTSSDPPPAHFNRCKSKMDGLIDLAKDTLSASSKKSLPPPSPSPDKKTKKPAVLRKRGRPRKDASTAAATQSQSPTVDMASKSPMDKREGSNRKSLLHRRNHSAATSVSSTSTNKHALELHYEKRTTRSDLKQVVRRPDYSVNVDIGIDASDDGNEDAGAEMDTETDAEDTAGESREASPAPKPSAKAAPKTPAAKTKGKKATTPKATPKPKATVANAPEDAPKNKYGFKKNKNDNSPRFTRTKKGELDKAKQDEEKETNVAKRTRCAEKGKERDGNARRKSD
ncbi:hypothetical protein K504DRAFT_46346 [Pleomassaria siparia CBS 279.74]|uniref:Uncharacterized protein n=1 Tax=Pleomassaria siparia CBS 279.74 TaxID=1314801 RepID=A0A6G1K4V0_9PLEO|nr:hypothetical protein K504DRAFT_46346 [Pleomassaria siparia CBS 279.74]